jgi:hypothetical protein
MRTGWSRGEQKLFRRLQQAGLTRGMVTNKPVVLVNTTLDEPREFETRPDFHWQQLGIPVYLDGPHHKRRHYADIDEKVDKFFLEQKGQKTLRFPYDPPLSDSRCAEIIEAIRKALVEAGYHG